MKKHLFRRRIARIEGRTEELAAGADERKAASREEPPDAKILGRDERFERADAVGTRQEDERVAQAAAETTALERVADDERHLRHVVPLAIANVPTNTDDPSALARDERDVILAVHAREVAPLRRREVGHQLPEALIARLLGQGLEERPEPLHVVGPDRTERDRREKIHDAPSLTRAGFPFVSDTR